MNRPEDSSWTDAPDEEDGQESGVEVEPEEQGLFIERPFDPEKIKVKTKAALVDSVVSRISHGEIDLAPDFQRHARIWNAPRKARLIESLLLRIPLPVFYVAADVNENWSVVDGLQRMTTINDFVNGHFPLIELEYLTQFNAHKFDDLPRPMRRRISETELVVHVIEPGTPEEVMFNIFSRINTGGMRLNGQEIRHALHKGPARDYLKRLSATNEFLDATAWSIRPDRMADRECALRFLAFRVTPWEEYKANDLDGFLSDAMKKLNQMSEADRDRLGGDFCRSMRAAHAIFDNDAFRKRYSEAAPRNPISKALFESWSVALARCDDDEIKRLVGIRDKVKLNFIELMNSDRSFDVSISYSTGVPQRVDKRFRAVDNLIINVLGKGS
jgi:Protein of unknown function DUF262